MIDDVKTITLFVLMAIASAYIRYKGFFQATIDAVLAFCFGYGVYLLLDYTSLSGACRCGISCILMIFSRPLYDWVEKFINIKFTELVEWKIKGGKNDSDNF